MDGLATLREAHRTPRVAIIVNRLRPHGIPKEPKVNIKLLINMNINRILSK